MTICKTCSVASLSSSYHTSVPIILTATLIIIEVWTDTIIEEKFRDARLLKVMWPKPDHIFELALNKSMEFVSANPSKLHYYWLKLSRLLQTNIVLKVRLIEILQPKSCVWDCRYISSLVGSENSALWL